MHARRGGDEGRRVYERGDEPAGVWACDRAARQRSKLHGDAGQQPLHRAISSGERSRGERASERAPAWVSEQAWARGPLATEGTPGSLPHGRAAARAPAGRRRGGARGCEGGPVGRARWGIGGERAGGRRGRGSVGSAGRENSPVRGRPWARADGCRGGARQLAVGQWRGRGNPRGRAWRRRGRPDGEEGRRGCSARAGGRSRQYVLLAIYHVTMGMHRMYVYICRCTFTSTHHRVPAHAW